MSGATRLGRVTVRSRDRARAARLDLVHRSEAVLSRLRGYWLSGHLVRFLDDLRDAFLQRRPPQITVGAEGFRARSLGFHGGGGPWRQWIPIPVLSLGTNRPPEIRGFIFEERHNGGRRIASRGS